MKWTHSRNIHKEDTALLVIMLCTKTSVFLSKHECVDTDTKVTHMKVSLTYGRMFEATEDIVALTV